MAEDRWYSVALPILEFVHENAQPLQFISIGQIAEGTGLDLHQVVAEAERLYSAGYLAGDVHKMMTGGDPTSWFLEDSSLGARGLRAVGAWPSDDPYDALVDLLERRIAATDDPEKKSKLRALKDSVAEVGKATVAGLLEEFAKGNVHF